MPEQTDVQPPSDVEGGTSAYQDVPADIREGVEHERHGTSPIEAWLGEVISKHALNLAMVAFTGYALATLVHRRSAGVKRATPARTPPASQASPRTTYRDLSVGRDERSSIRYR